MDDDQRRKWEEEGYLLLEHVLPEDEVAVLASS